MIDVFLSFAERYITYPYDYNLARLISPFGRASLPVTLLLFRFAHVEEVFAFSELSILEVSFYSRNFPRREQRSRSRKKIFSQRYFAMVAIIE